VASIEKATAVADGDVSGRPTDIVITFDGSLDQSVPGRSLAAGDQIKVIFPPEFDLSDIDPAYPVADVPTPGQCVPNDLRCTTAVLLQGWPDQPPFPPAAHHTMSIDTAENAFILTAVQDIGPISAASPGIKQLFLIMNGVRNPEPDVYHIQVESQTGQDGAWETGSGMLKIVPRTRPSINITSVFVKALAGVLSGSPACGPGTLPPNPDNPIYQTTLAGEAAPFVWSFLLWGKNNDPLDDIGLSWVGANHARLVRGQKTVGHVFINTPSGAEGHGIEVNPYNCPTWFPGAPVIGPTFGIGPQAVGRLDLRFWAGSEPGEYTTTISMNGGNSVQMTVTAE
jgi:hypothetical protein